MSSVPLDLPLPRGLRVQHAVRLGRERRAQAAALGDGHALADRAAAEAVQVAHAAAEAAKQRGHEEGFQAGHDEGLQQGVEAGRAQAEAELAAARDRAVAGAVAEATALLREQQQVFAQLAAQWREQSAQRRLAAENEIAAACFETICRIVGTQLATPDGVRSQVTFLLAGVESDTLPLVRVHPRHLHALQGALPSGSCRCVADEEVGTGGCIVEVGPRVLDARLETVLEQCKSAWHGVEMADREPAQEHAG